MRRRFKHTPKAIRSEINMTSLIDVMMSLLAIFMITAPLITSGIPLTLPKGDGKAFTGSDKTLDISVNPRGQIYIGKENISLQNLTKKVRAIVSENPHIQIVISGDRTSSYGDVIEVMALLRAQGFTQVGLRTDAQKMESD